VNEDLAFAHCEHLTRTQARNFYYGIRLLPGPKRRGLCAIYAFARRVDDIGDGAGSLSDEERLARLEAARRSVERAAPDSPDPVLSALGHARASFPIPMEAFGDLIDGVAMDVRGTAYESFGELEPYCRRVAGSIGRLSVGVFGASDPTAMSLADDLGVAMQLTNILRDVREDLDRGRMYVPREDLERFGCGSDLAAPHPEALTSLILFEARRARSWFDRGLSLVPLLDPRSASCVTAMTGIYRRLLARIEDRPERVLRERLSLAPWEKVWVAARSLTGAGTAAARAGPSR
jgi:15-cis-phytoene synthase